MTAMTRFVKQLFARDRRPFAARRSGSTQLHAESLETREMPAGLAAVFSGTRLTVTGTDANEAIVVREVDGLLKVKGAQIHLNDAAGRAVTGVKAAKVTELRVVGTGGHDTIDISRVESKMHGTLVGGTGRDKITGSRWSDTIQGSRGADTIIDDFAGIDVVVKDDKDRVITPFDDYLGSAPGAVKTALGASTGKIEVAADGVGRVEAFTKGWLVWSPTTNAHAVFEVALAKWAALGGVNGFLGYPTSEQVPVNEGFVVHFQGGDIYATEMHGAHEIHGDILARYNALGGAKFIGLPTSDELPTAGGEGRYNHFQSGMIYWSPASGAHVIYGAILEKWVAMNYEHSFLGYPTSDELPAAGGRVSHFQGGEIYWSPATGAHAVAGAIYRKWEAMNWELGALGYPISEVRVTSNGDRSIGFQHGTIVLSAADGIAREIVRIDGVPGGSPQNDNWSCGPNSAARFLRYYGYEVSYEQIRAMTEANNDLVSLVHAGTRPNTLRDVIGQFRPETQLESRVDTNYPGGATGKVFDLLASGKPVIALVNVGGTANVWGFGTHPTALHYVVLTGYNRVNQTVTFMDTSGYSGSWSFSEFNARWNWQCSGVPGAFLDGLGVHPRTIIY